MWQPITDADSREAAWSVVEEIDRCLSDHLRTGDAGSVRQRNPTLAGGTSGLALFFAYLDAARPGSSAGERALEVLDQAIDDLAEGELASPLYSGFTGVGWVVEHLTREFFDGDDDMTAAIDEGLAGILAEPSLLKPYELMRGVAGFGTYLLERLPHPGAAELLPRVLDHLERAAERSPAGCTWYTHPDWMPAWQRSQMPSGYYNLGLAHGVPGVVGFLAAAHHAGLEDDRIPTLAEATVRWLLAQRLPEGRGSAFPAYVVPGTDPEPTRTGWCYGDLGVAVVLLAAARSFGRPDWEREALALARLAAGRPESVTGAIDGGLCHGTAGNAHLFLRLFQATGDPLMREVALAWLRRTLALHRPGEEMAGYLSWITADGGARGYWQAEAGFLTGVAGIGLALLAAVSDVEPAWDRVMLISIPPGTAAADREGGAR